MSSAGVVILELFWPVLLSAVPIADAIVADVPIAAAPIPTEKAETGFVIVPACLPISRTPSLAMPFSSSLTAPFFNFLAFRYVLFAPRIAPSIFPLCMFLITEPTPSTTPPGPKRLLVPPPSTLNGEGSLS